MKCHKSIICEQMDLEHANAICKAVHEDGVLSQESQDLNALNPQAEAKVQHGGSQIAEDCHR